MGRASTNQINVVSNSLGGKLVNVADRDDGDVVVWNEALDKYKHEHLPTDVSDLAEDATHRTVTDAEKGIWNEKQDAGDYLVAADISGKEDTSNKSTSVTTDGASDTKYPSVKAVKDYADSLVVGLIDDRGNYDASVNTFPATGGSGTAGAILKGDLWFISVGGTLGGVIVLVGHQIRALVDTPGQTAGNWAIMEGDVAYTPENAANKVTSISVSSTDVQYASAKLLYDQLLFKQDALTADVDYLTPENTNEHVAQTIDDMLEYLESAIMAVQQQVSYLAEEIEKLKAV